VQGAIVVLGVAREHDREVTIRMDSRCVSIVGSQRMDIRRFVIIPQGIRGEPDPSLLDVFLHLVAKLAA
jgi:hypothetical protein